MPLDPYTGDALLMRRSEQGLIIYCVGPNGADDGGVDRDDTVRSDVVFELRQP